MSPAIDDERDEEIRVAPTYLQGLASMALGPIREPEPSGNKGRAVPGEAGLVHVARIRSLFDLKHFEILKDFEPVASFDKENHVAGPQHAAFQIDLVIIVEINPERPPAQEQRLLGVFHRANDGIVNMGIDDSPRRMLHVGQLLG